MRTLSDGDVLFGAEVQALFREAMANGSAIMSGCSPSAGANALEVDVASGSAEVDGSSYSIGSTTITLASRDTYDRYDLVVIDGTGSVTSITGSTELTAPDLPTGNALLAVVKVPSSGSITVNDSRILIGQLAVDVLIGRTLSPDTTEADKVAVFDELDVPTVTSDQSTAGRLWYRSDLD